MDNFERLGRIEHEIKGIERRLKELNEIKNGLLVAINIQNAEEQTKQQLEIKQEIKKMENLKAKV